MSYIDGFVVPVPTATSRPTATWRKKAWPLFQEFGATRLVECWGDDLPDGKHTDFKGAVKAEPGENVVFSWVVYPSKAVRDEANKRMREDPRMKAFADMPFDGKRMIFGGFTMLLDTGEA
jgi:uncharacterized protein YbaA (DUF1428 family)